MNVLKKLSPAFDFSALPPELLALVPKTKTDILAAKEAIRAGYPTIIPVLPVLLCWLQDYNWPVAQVLAPFLADIGMPLKEAVAEVLQSEDIIWRYWVITLLINTPDLRLASVLKQELWILRDVYLLSSVVLDEDQEREKVEVDTILANLSSVPGGRQ